MGGRPPLLLQILGRLVSTQSAADGARPIIFAATSPDVAQGSYYGPRYSMVGPAAPAKVPTPATDKAVAARLWTLAEELTGVTTPTAV
jgi:hypothetical protein